MGDDFIIRAALIGCLSGALYFAVACPCAVYLACHADTVVGLLASSCALVAYAWYAR